MEQIKIKGGKLPPPPSGPLSSHARRCCHSESRLCSVQDYCSQPPPFRPAEGTPLASKPFLQRRSFSVAALHGGRVSAKADPEEPIPVVSFCSRKVVLGTRSPSSCCRCLLKPEFTESNQRLHNSSCTRPTAGGFYFLAVLKSAGRVLLGLKDPPHPSAGVFGYVLCH